MIGEGKKPLRRGDHFRRAATVAADDRQTGRHGFEQHHAEGLAVRTQDENVERGEITTRLGNLAEKADASGNTQFRSQRAQRTFQPSAG